MQSILTTILSILKNAYGRITKIARQVWSGSESENPKVIVNPGIWRAFQKISVHLLSIAATAALASLNLATYFVGSQYQGSDNAVWQHLDSLALQITAKLYVSAQPNRRLKFCRRFLLNLLHPNSPP